MVEYSDCIIITRGVDHDVISIAKYMMYDVLGYGLKEGIIKDVKQGGTQYTIPRNIKFKFFDFIFLSLDQNRCLSVGQVARDPTQEPTSFIHLNYTHDCMSISNVRSSFEIRKDDVIMFSGVKEVMQ